jgi:hypothetical protein
MMNAFEVLGPFEPFAADTPAPPSRRPSSSASDAVRKLIGVG